MKAQNTLPLGPSNGIVVELKEANALIRHALGRDLHMADQRADGIDDMRTASEYVRNAIRRLTRGA